MNKYTELNSKHADRVNAFPIGFAFSNEQFEEAKERLGIESNDELISVDNGGFIRKTDSLAYQKLFIEINNEDKEAMKDDEYLYQGFLYELANHEFGITYDPEPTLECFGLTPSDILDDERLNRIFKEARAKYLDGFEY